MNFPTKLRKIGANMLQKAVNQLQNGQNIGYRMANIGQIGL